MLNYFGNKNKKSDNFSIISEDLTTIQNASQNIKQAFFSGMLSNKAYNDGLYCFFSVFNSVVSVFLSYSAQA